MSDFDKEAEREKLREKFERDKQKRQQSERMSELLLKGATMTNKHHDCGSPIFRWQGEEFCPSCESPAGAGAEATADQQTEPGAESQPTESANGTGSAASDVADETADAARDAVDEATAEASSAVDAGADEPDATDATEIDVAAEPTADGTDSTSTRADPSGRGDGTDRTTDDGMATNESVAAAAASVERTLADLSREAEETRTTDLSRKRNLIAATREAAEALEAIRRAARQ